jgi:hypothetical protein
MRPEQKKKKKKKKDNPMLRTETAIANADKNWQMTMFLHAHAARHDLRQTRQS